MHNIHRIPISNNHRAASRKARYGFFLFLNVFPIPRSLLLHDVFGGRYDANPLQIVDTPFHVTFTKLIGVELLVSLPE